MAAHAAAEMAAAAAAIVAADVIGSLTAPTAAARLQLNCGVITTVMLHGGTSSSNGIPNLQQVSTSNAQPMQKQRQQQHDELHVKRAV